MRKIMVCGVLLGGLVIAMSSQSCKGESEPINGVCKDFCDKLVDAMDDSDFYDLSYEGVAGTKKSCGQDCTEVVNEYKKLDRGDMGDCVECIADKGFNQIGDACFPDKDEWRMSDIPGDIPGHSYDSDTCALEEVGDDCMKKCDRDDIEYGDDDGLLIAEFLQDFQSDFVDHWSGAEPFCDGYGGDDLCCKESNPCAILDNNGDCECGGDCSWDTYDCNDGTDIDTDVDTDVDSDTDTDTDLTYCEGYTGTSACCTEDNLCDWSEDGTCDCDATCSWDTLDCGV
ncbi:MAG: hypothetical protein M0R80_16705 [Proteobacteria bacterium]|jgi:hypothetical protein|nr:hypothetical protein [Pseudomonadota bacterium]